MAGIISFLWSFVKTFSNHVYNTLFSEEHPPMENVGSGSGDSSGSGDGSGSGINPASKGPDDSGDGSGDSGINPTSKGPDDSGDSGINPTSKGPGSGDGSGSGNGSGGSGINPTSKDSESGNSVETKMYLVGIYGSNGFERSGKTSTKPASSSDSEDDSTARPGKTSTKPASKGSDSKNTVERLNNEKHTSNSKGSGCGGLRALRALSSSSDSGDDSTIRPEKTSTNPASVEQSENKKKPTPKPKPESDSGDKPTSKGSGSGDSVEQLEKETASGDGSGNSGSAKPKETASGDSSGNSGGAKPKTSTSTPKPPSGSGPGKTSTSAPKPASGPGSAWSSGFWTTPDSPTFGSDRKFLSTDSSNDILDSGPGRTLILLPDVRGTQAGHVLYVQMESGFRIVINTVKEELPPHLLKKGQREKDLYALKAALRENKEFLKDRRFRLLVTSVPVFLFLLNASSEELEFLEDFSFSLAFANKNDHMPNPE